MKKSTKKMNPAREELMAEFGTILEEISKDVKTALEGYGFLSNQIEGVRVELTEKLESFQFETKENFRLVDKRFEQVDERFEQVDKRFDKMDERFEQVDKRFDQMDKRFELVDKRLNAIDGQLKQMNKKSDTMREEVLDIKKEIARLKKELSGKAEMKKVFDLEVRVHAIEKTMAT